MCSTNPSNWVTFDDDPAFQSSQRSKSFSLESPGVCRPNGLKLPLNLPGLREFPSAPSSTGSTPVSSPMVDFYFSPGPPSNSPLCTPTKDFPGFPGIPKAGTHVLYPIPECSSGSPMAAAEAACPLLPTQPAGSSPAPSPSDRSGAQPSATARLAGMSTSQQADSGGLPEDSQYFRGDCAFSNPFWKDTAPQLPSDPPASGKTPASSRDWEVPMDQKSLNKHSLNYICEKLEHLQSTESQDPPGHPPPQGPRADPSACSFVPRTLFRSQPKAGWSFMLRIPEKKNVMSSRQWGPIFLRVLRGGVLQMYYAEGLEKPFRELQLDPCCRLSEPKVENFSVGKIHTVKIEHVSYSERRKYHPKTEVVHEPDIEQMLKLGTPDYQSFLEFLTTVEEELIRLPAAASRPKKTYEEQQMYLDVVDHFWGKVTKEEGRLVESAVVTRISGLCFVNGAADCFLTLNDRELLNREGGDAEKEPAKKGIDLLDYHFHACVRAGEFPQSRIIRFAPLDACRFELMRFKTSYPGDDLPFSVKSSVVVQGAHVELQAFVNMTPGAPAQASSSRCCDNITIHFPAPAQWSNALWTLNLQRQKSLKAKMNRRACLGSSHEPAAEPAVQVTVGSAKYESAYRAVVWKIDRLPDKNSSPDHPHCLSYKLELGSDQEIPSDWYPFATVQFSMPETCASGTEVRSLGVESDVQPQKHVHQRACFNVQVEIEKKWIKIDGEDPDKAGSCATQ